MNKDRKITLFSIMLWAACIILLFGYYTFVDDGNKKSKQGSGGENKVIEQTDNRANEYESKAKEYIANMTLSEKVGQMFFARCPQQGAQSAIKDYNIGAYILFARDFEGQTKDSIKSKIDAYQSNAKVPLLIGVDEEGGTVTRVSRFRNFRNEKFKSPMDIYNSGGLDAIEADTKEKCELLKSIGVNVNFAPVCDITTDKDSFIYNRTLGQDKDVTATYVKQMVQQMDSLKVGSVLKHFPGYGSNVDTHVGSATDNRSLDELRENDFIPFKEGIAAGARCILVSHNIVKSIDEVNPCSMSPNLHNLLREELGYNGVIITDDLDMDAIGSSKSSEQVAIEAVKAGNDMVITSKYVEQITAVKSAVSNGEISEDRINESVIRILSWKMALGLM